MLRNPGRWGVARISDPSSGVIRRTLILGRLPKANWSQVSSQCLHGWVTHHQLGWVMPAVVGLLVCVCVCVCVCSPHTAWRVKVQCNAWWAKHKEAQYPRDDSAPCDLRSVSVQEVVCPLCSKCAEVGVVEGCVAGLITCHYRPAVNVCIFIALTLKENFCIFQSYLFPTNVTIVTLWVTF